MAGCTEQRTIRFVRTIRTVHNVRTVRTSWWTMDGPKVDGRESGHVCWKKVGVPSESGRSVRKWTVLLKMTGLLTIYCCFWPSTFTQFDRPLSPRAVWSPLRTRSTADNEQYFVGTRRTVRAGANTVRWNLRPGPSAANLNCPWTCFTVSDAKSRLRNWSKMKSWNWIQMSLLKGNAPVSK